MTFEKPPYQGFIHTSTPTALVECVKRAGNLQKSISASQKFIIVLVQVGEVSKTNGNLFCSISAIGALFNVLGAIAYLGGDFRGDCFFRFVEGNYLLSNLSLPTVSLVVRSGHYYTTLLFRRFVVGLLKGLRRNELPFKSKPCWKKSPRNYHSILLMLSFWN